MSTFDEWWEEFSPASKLLERRALARAAWKAGCEAYPAPVAAAQSAGTAVELRTPAAPPTTEEPK